MNPSGCIASNFKQPTAWELAHDFLWRVHPHVPAKGSVAIFNRSHYEDVLVARVHNLVPEKVWSKRYDQINDFEQLIATENNTTILKFFLHISKQEQLERFKKRLDDPARQWKISDSDYKERDYWKDYTEAFEDVLNKTSTERAPWFIIPSNHKWFRNLAISQIITRAMEEMKMQLPKPTVNLAEIRREYHQAAAAEKSGHSKT
jgi:PPK2 family polyphosphate:nucleotide phosphotransferase